MTTPAAPDLSDDLLVYRFERQVGAGEAGSDFERAVIIDRGNQVIHFCNCHSRRTFFALRAQPLVTCRFDEVLAAYQGRHREAVWIDVLTPTGKARIPKADPAGGFDDLCQQLRHLAPDDLRAPAEEHPLMILVYVAGGLGGLVAPLCAMPRDSGAPATVLAGIFGVVSGIAGVYWAVRLSHRWFGVKLALPLGLGIVGALAGLVVFFQVVCAFVVGNEIHAGILLAVGSLAGFLLGAVLEKRKSRGRPVQDGKGPTQDLRG
jgi:hypothetical protein